MGSVGELAEQDVLQGTATPCTTMSAPQLDFDVDTNSGDILSVEAKAMVGGSTTVSSVTLYVTSTGTGASVAIGVRVIGSGSATIVDGTGATTTATATATGEPTLLSVSVPAGTTFSITSTTSMTTAAPDKTETPRPTPPSAKKAVIKPVTRCPA